MTEAEKKAALSGEAKATALKQLLDARAMYERACSDLGPTALAAEACKHMAVQLVEGGIFETIRAALSETPEEYHKRLNPPIFLAPIPQVEPLEGPHGETLEESMEYLDKITQTQFSNDGRLVLCWLVCDRYKAMLKAQGVKK